MHVSLHTCVSLQICMHVSVCIALACVPTHNFGCSFVPVDVCMRTHISVYLSLHTPIHACVCMPSHMAHTYADKSRILHFCESWPVRRPRYRPLTSCRRLPSNSFCLSIPLLLPPACHLSILLPPGDPPGPGIACSLLLVHNKWGNVHWGTCPSGCRALGQFPYGSFGL